MNNQKVKLTFTLNSVCTSYIREDSDDSTAEKVFKSGKRFVFYPKGSHFRTKLVGEQFSLGVGFENDDR